MISLDRLDEWRTAHQEVHRLEAEALTLHAAELGRRLESLNHEAQRIAADKVTYATNERVDSLIREAGNNAAARAESVDAQLDVLTTFKNRALGFGVLLSLVSAGAGALLVKTLGG